jgi:hypothetical protein
MYFASDFRTFIVPYAYLEMTIKSMTRPTYLDPSDPMADPSGLEVKRVEPDQAKERTKQVQV